MSDKCVFIKIKGMTYREYELYYKKPVDDVHLKKATVFNNKHIYWLMTENGRQSRLGNFKRLATYHSGRREDDYDYDMYEFTEGNVLAENSKYIYCVSIPDSDTTKKDMQPVEHMKYLSYPVYYPSSQSPPNGSQSPDGDGSQSPPSSPTPHY